MNLPFPTLILRHGDEDTNDEGAPQVLIHKCMHVSTRQKQSLNSIFSLIDPPMSLEVWCEILSIHLIMMYVLSWIFQRSLI